MLRLASKIAQNALRGKFTNSVSNAFAETEGVGKMFAKMRDIIAEQNSDTPTLEYHGAIRLGLPEEMTMMRRFFAILGMEPVGFYDLSQVAKPLPVVATAFRPLTRAEIDEAPFRMFTSLFMIDGVKPNGERFIPEELARDLETYFKTRKLFSDRCVELIEKAEKEDCLTPEEATEFVAEATKTFAYSGKNVPKILYDKVKQHTDYGGDVVVGSAHINHLTPNTKDIFETQELLTKEFGVKGMLPEIQGPKNDGDVVQLLQSSFKAPPIPTVFIDENGQPIEGSHTACFGEFEQRGAALTPKGRDALDKSLEAFPKTYDKMMDKGYIYCTYHLTEEGENASKEDITQLTLKEMIEKKLIMRKIITYEDFLAASARNIFSSTVDEKEELTTTDAIVGEGSSYDTAKGNYELLVAALGGIEPNNLDELYMQEMNESLRLLATSPNLCENGLLAMETTAISIRVASPCRIINTTRCATPIPVTTATQSSAVR